MSLADRRRWDERYRSAKVGTPSPTLVGLISHLPSQGRVLDVACGTGANALYLAARGHNVVALDGSEVGLRLLRDEAERRDLAPQIQAVLADISALPLRAPEFDGVVVWSLLDRELLAGLPTLLRAGGVLIFSTFHRGHLEARPGFPARWMLARGEAPTLFPALEIVHAAEDDARAVVVARLRSTDRPPEAPITADQSR